MKFDLIDIILSLGIVQGLFVAFILNQISDKNKSANSMLSLILIIAALVLSGKMLFVHQIQLSEWLALTDAVIYLFGPLSYVYIRRLLIKSETPYKLHLIHYLPATVHIIVFSFLALQGKSIYTELYENGTLYWIYNFLEITGLASNFFYLTGNFFLLRSYKKEEKNKISYTQNFHKFLFPFLGAIFLSLASWVVSYIHSYYLFLPLPYISYNTIWITIPAFTYIVGYFSLKQPELFRMPKTALGKSFMKRLSDLDASKLRQNLEQLLVIDRIYLKNDLTLGELSSKLNASSNDISWLLNNEYKSSFYDFINQYRVKEFLDRIENNVHARQTILSIAFDVGFNTKSTFNKAFKTQMQMTPSHYIKRLETTSQMA